jgi:putative transposase
MAIEPKQASAMLRAHRIRLNPTPAQEAYFRKAAGTARFVYNWGLAEVKRALDDGRTPARVLDLKTHFNALKPEQFPWVYKVGFPKFKKRKRNTGSFYLANDKFSVGGHWLNVPKLGKVNMTERLRLAGKIMGAAISERVGWWWVSIVVDLPGERPLHQGRGGG